MKPAWKNRISMAAKESHLQRACTDYLDIWVAQDRIRYCVMPDGDFRRRGKGYCPDIIIWIKCEKEIMVLTFELKSPKGTGRLTEKQKDFKKWLDDSWHDHFITNDFDEFKRVLDKALN